MRSVTRWAAIAGLTLCASGHSMAQSASSWAIAPQWQSSNDSDGLKIDKRAIAALPSYASGLQWQGLEWQTQRYAQNGTTLDSHTLSYVAQNLHPISGLGQSYRLGWNQGLGSSLVTGEFNWSQAFNDRLQWGVFASRDWVESLPALQSQVHYDLVGGNIDYRVHPRLTAVASLAQTRFSDHQDRQQQRVRLIWDAWPEQGVTLQWAYKHQLGEKDASPRLYFNPERLDESIAFVGWRRRFEGWQLYARAGWGQQKIIDQEATPARVFELNLNSPIYGQQFFKLRLGRNETFGLNATGTPGYAYRYADVQWIWRL
jgi:hypothetical protein